MGDFISFMVNVVVISGATVFVAGMRFPSKFNHFVYIVVDVLSVNLVQCVFGAESLEP